MLPFLAGMPALPTFPQGLPPISAGASSGGTQSGPSFMGGNFTVGGESTQMYLFIGGALFIGAFVYLATRKK